MYWLRILKAGKSSTKEPTHLAGFFCGITWNPERPVESKMGKGALIMAGYWLVSR